MPSRYIPRPLQRQLRQEVNWGCPVAGCGSPFLSYHHFDPPFRDFREDTQHEAEGIIALCLNHAAGADGGAFTNDQLRQMKRSPYLQGDRVRATQQGWLRRGTVLRAGSNLFLNIATLVAIGDEKVIWFSRNADGYIELSMNIRDVNGDPVFVMDRNDWVAFGDLSDVEARPRGRDLVVKSTERGFQLKLTFQDLLEPTLRREIEEKALARAKDSAAGAKALREALIARDPGLAGMWFDDAAPIDESRVREDAWEPIASTMPAWPALEIQLDGTLPAPIHMISSKDELELPGMIMSGSLFIGEGMTAFHFQPSAR